MKHIPDGRELTNDGWSRFGLFGDPRNWGAVPESFGHEEEDEEATESKNNSDGPIHVKNVRAAQPCLLAEDLPKDPTPSHLLNDDSAHERNQVLATKQEECVDADAEGPFVEEEDLGNGG